jgi:hypothetical protein
MASTPTGKKQTKKTGSKPTTTADQEQIKAIEAKFERLLQLQKEESELKQKTKGLNETLKLPKEQLGGEIGKRAILPKINPDKPDLDLEVKKVPKWHRAPPLELAWQAIDMILGKDAVDQIQDYIKKERSQKSVSLASEECVTLQVKDLNKSVAKRNYERNSSKNPNFVRYSKRSKKSTTTSS